MPHINPFRMPFSSVCELIASCPLHMVLLHTLCLKFGNGALNTIEVSTSIRLCLHHFYFSSSTLFSLMYSWNLITNFGILRIHSSTGNVSGDTLYSCWHPLNTMHACFTFGSCLGFSKPIPSLLMCTFKFQSSYHMYKFRSSIVHTLSLV